MFLDFHRACPEWDHNWPATGEGETFFPESRENGVVPWIGLKKACHLETTIRFGMPAAFVARVADKFTTVGERVFERDVFAVLSVVRVEGSVKPPVGLVVGLTGKKWGGSWVANKLTSDTIFP